MTANGSPLHSVGLSHVGRVRQLNEDAWLARPDLGLWAVADGMGGHSRGDLASRTVVESLGRLALATDARSHLRAVEDALGWAHAELHRRASGTGDLCGSTAVVLLAFGRHYAVVWAGDSRAYRLRAGRLERLTRDHSAVEEMVGHGLLTPAEARVHPFRNRITRAVGIEGPLALDRHQGELAPGDVLLLCSDGLTGHLDDDEIAGMIAGRPLETAAQALIEATLADGATDNVTVVLAVASGNVDPELTHPWARG